MYCECAMWFIGIMVTLFGIIVAIFGVFLPYKQNKKVSEMYEKFIEDKYKEDCQKRTNSRVYEEYLKKYPMEGDETRLSSKGLSKLLSDKRYKI